MLNVTDHYCISPATSKGGFPVIRVICHESVIYVAGHVSHRSVHLLGQNFPQATLACWAL